MLNLDLWREFFRWLMGETVHQAQPLPIPVEKERRRDA